MDSNERKSEEADELEAVMEERKAANLEAERDEKEDLNQGMQTGTHDALHLGIKWGSSYRIKKTSGNPESRD